MNKNIFSFNLSPSKLQNLIEVLDAYNRDLLLNEEATLSWSVSSTYLSDPKGDQLARWEVLKVEVYTSSTEIFDIIRNHDFSDNPEWRFPRNLLIGYSFASMRQNGTYSYISEKDDPDRSTMNEVLNATVNKDNPDRDRLTPHEGDNIQTRGLLAWVRKLDNSTDYNRALKRVVSSDYVSYRGAKMLISATGAHQQRVRERVQKQARIKANEKSDTTKTGSYVPSKTSAGTNMATGSWLGSVGKQIAVSFKVIESRWVENKYSEWGDSVMIVGEDILGNRIRFFYADSATPKEGIWLNASGTVKEHRVVGGRKETLLARARCWF
ncbi:hypothetical protein [Rothia amarae]|uniref:hypothetical protein n=1 Tax=Rothia amarae TaxID=169480 RepID=UPI0031D82C14